MSILRAANSWVMNGFIALCVLALCIGLPLIDHSVCKHLGLSLTHGISTNPHAEKLQRRRRRVLYGIFGLYLLANLYLVFVSRGESTEYRVHTDLMVDLANSVHFDLGLFGTFEEMLVSGFREGWSHVHVVKSEDITQVLMNTMFYIPMGYLLPYVFRSFQGRKNRTVFTCFLFSFITENIQLIFKRGTYDLDDLFFNTLGGLIGYAFYKTFAYYLTHPGWRKELHAYNRWKRHARKKPLAVCARGLHRGRATLFTSDWDTIRNYYVDKLGFRPTGRQGDNEVTSAMLLRLGGMSVEVRPLPAVTFPQQLYITADNLDSLKKRLEKSGIPVSGFLADPYTNRRTVQVEAPDNTTIIFIE